MLTRFEAQGFKLLRDVAVDLTPLTVLVGANGTGKTTLLEGIDLWLTIAEKVKSSIGWHFQRQDLAEFVSRPAGRQASLALTLDGHVPAVLRFDTKGSGEVVLEADTRAMVQALPRVRHLDLDVKRIAASSIASTGEPQMEPDGFGLPTLLQDIASRRDGVIEAIESELVQIVPAFRRIHTLPTKVEWTDNEVVRIDSDALERQVKRTGGGYRLELEFESIGRVGADHVSEGTLLALAIITTLHVDGASLVLLDDLDRALHPAAQHTLIGLIRGAIDRRDGTLQVIATTHSPYLVDACRPEEIRAFGRKSDGSTAVRPLTAHPEAEKWLALLETGEFWSSIGEAWVGESVSVSEPDR